MSNNKGFSDTSAARYSLALYELANEANIIEEVEGNSIDILKFSHVILLQPFTGLDDGRL